MHPRKNFKYQIESLNPVDLAEALQFNGFANCKSFIIQENIDGQKLLLLGEFEMKQYTKYMTLKELNTLYDFKEKVKEDQIQFKFVSDITTLCDNKSITGNADVASKVPPKPKIPRKPSLDYRRSICANDELSQNNINARASRSHEIERDTFVSHVSSKWRPISTIQDNDNNEEPSPPPISPKPRTNHNNSSIKMPKNVQKQPSVILTEPEQHFQRISSDQEHLRSIKKVNSDKFREELSSKLKNMLPSEINNNYDPDKAYEILAKPSSSEQSNRSNSLSSQENENFNFSYDSEAKRNYRKSTNFINDFEETFSSDSNEEEFAQFGSCEIVNKNDSVTIERVNQNGEEVSQVETKTSTTIRIRENFNTVERFEESKRKLLTEGGTKENRINNEEKIKKFRERPLPPLPEEAQEKDFDNHVDKKVPNENKKNVDCIYQNLIPPEVGPKPKNNLSVQNMKKENSLPNQNNISREFLNAPELPSRDKKKNLIISHEVQNDEIDSSIPPLPQKNHKVNIPTYEMINENGSYTSNNEPKAKIKQMPSDALGNGKLIDTLYEPQPEIRNIPPNLKHLCQRDLPPIPEKPAENRASKLTNLKTLVPKRSTTSSESLDEKLMDHPYFRDWTRDECVKELNSKEIGAFVIRPSNKTFATIVVKGNIKIYNVPITYEKNSYYLNGELNTTFKLLSRLIEFYCDNKLSLTQEKINLKLVSLRK